MKKIKLTQGKVALVDNKDFDFLNQFKWYLFKNKNNFYARCSVIIKGKRKQKFMHRMILNVSDDKIIDHRNRRGLDNQRHNLRVASFQQNNANRKSHKKSTSKYLGVCFEPSRKKFKACITINYKPITLGRFINEKDAAKCYNFAALKYHGEFANLNKV